MSVTLSRHWLPERRAPHFPAPSFCAPRSVCVIMLLLLLLAALLPAPARADAATPAARELAACDVQALARPAAVPSLAFDTSALLSSCGGFKGYTFSARVLSPNQDKIGVYLGVGAAQCGASCVLAAQYVPAAAPLSFHHPHAVCPLPPPCPFCMTQIALIRTIFLQVHGRIAIQMQFLLARCGLPTWPALTQATAVCRCSALKPAAAAALL